jgi:hypothetical protein
MQSVPSVTFCGQSLEQDQVDEIAMIVATFPKLTRSELANTICELFEWKRPTGKLKTVECRQFLEDLEARGIIRLPACQSQFAQRTKFSIDKTASSNAQAVLSVKLSDLAPVLLDRVKSHAERQLWYEYVDRYHYLGYRLPFGAQVRYFIQSKRSRDYLGCLQFSSPAWKMAARDQWIGWSDEERKKNLQKIISNSRFLIFPWVRVNNLASVVLSLAAKIVPHDWCETYGYRPVLIETLVDKQRFNGTCYRAANWVHVGQTTGRGRMDRQNKRKGMAVKDIFIYPLAKRFRQELSGS